jgi:hypothetical protein
LREEGNSRPPADHGETEGPAKSTVKGPGTLANPTGEKAKNRGGFGNIHKLLPINLYF